MGRLAVLASRAFVLALAIFFVPEGKAAEALYRFAPVGSWVTPAQASYTAAEPTDKTTGGSWILLLDQQINVTAAGDDSYQHVAAKILNDTGVEAQSQVDLRLDPAFQTLDMHFVRVIRDGKTVIDARRAAKITVLPEENRLRERVYDGREHINILISDVRAGDVVEYAFTVHSRETLFPNHFAGVLSVAWSDPVHWQRIRLRWPRGRVLRARLSDGAAVPAPIVVGDSQELVLQWQNLAPIPLDDAAPGWYSPWPRLEITDYAGWSQVVRLVEPLYTHAGPAGARVAAVAQQLKAAGGSPEQLALRALQFVQEQISYVSMSIGHGAYRPSGPETVLERRYGDCKDKSVLLVALLRELRIESQPALVHSRRGRTLPDSLPSPFAFDHAIVRMQIGTNTYWLDGTATKQYAELSPSVPADFEQALVLTVGTLGLAAIPRPATDASRKEIFMTFDLHKGVEQPATLSVVARYSAQLADEMRQVLARTSLDQRKTDYLNYIARYYAGAKLAGPIVVNDDKAADVVEVRESYTLDSGFTKKGTKIELMLHADELYGYADPVSSTVRRAPLALDFPIYIRQNISVLLPESWPVTPGKTRIDNPAFHYEGDISYSAKTLELTYHYEALKSEIEPAALKQYLADRKRFYDDLGYTLTQNANVPAVDDSGIAPAPFLTLLLSLGLSLWGAFRLANRWDPQPREPRAGAPEGFGGWLILPALGALVGPFITVLVIVEWLPFVRASMWHALPTVTNETFRSTAHLALLAIVMLSGPLLAMRLATAYLFFTKRTAAPRAFIISNWAGVVYGAGVVAWVAFAGLDENASPARDIGAAVRDVIGTTIWTAYMLRSDRVKATFRRRSKQNTPAAPGELSSAPIREHHSTLIGSSFVS